MSTSNPPAKRTKHDHASDATAAAAAAIATDAAAADCPSPVLDEKSLNAADAAKAALDAHSEIDKLRAELAAAQKELNAMAGESTAELELRIIHLKRRLVVAEIKAAIDKKPKKLDSAIDTALWNVLEDGPERKRGVFYLTLRRDVPATVDLEDRGSVTVTAQEDRNRGPKTLMVYSVIKLKVDITGEAEKEGLVVSYLDTEMRFEECAKCEADGDNRLQVPENLYAFFTELPKVYESFIIVRVEMRQ